MSDKVSHLKDQRLLQDDAEKRTYLQMPDGRGQIIGYQPFKSMQIVYYDVRSNDMPDLWKLGLRKGGKGRYLRTLICKRGQCDLLVNGKSGRLCAGQVMMDYGVGDNETFTFASDLFMGVEITMQVDTLVEESAMMKMLRLVIESMELPEEEIYDSDGYIFSYSKNTDTTLDKLLGSGFERKAGIVSLALVIEIGHSLGDDLKRLKIGLPNKQRMIAEDIHRCLTEDFGVKYTAAHFAQKYGLSDTIVKKYFKVAYGYSFKEYQNKVRMERAATMLTASSMKVKDIAEAVGYKRPAKFAAAFKAYYGETPLVYRQNKKLRAVQRNE